MDVCELSGGHIFYSVTKTHRYVFLKGKEYFENPTLTTPVLGAGLPKATPDRFYKRTFYPEKPSVCVLSFPHPLLQSPDFHPPRQIRPSARWTQIHKQVLPGPHYLPRALSRPSLGCSWPSTPPAPLVTQRVLALLLSRGCTRSCRRHCFLLLPQQLARLAVLSLPPTTHSMGATAGGATCARSRWSWEPAWTRPLSHSVLWPFG